MGIHYIWTTANPELRPYLRKSAEARAAAHSAAWRVAWRAVADSFGRLARMIERARRRSRNRAELSGLSDHVLRDIGLSRADIGRFSRIAADAATGLTVAELRQRDALEGVPTPDSPLPAADGRHRRPSTGTVRRVELPEQRRAATH